MKDYNEKLIETKTLENGVKVSLFDFCKPVAADRWYVKILCRIELDIPPEKLAASGLDEAGQLAFNERFAGVLVHEFAKERHFIDDNVKDEAVRAIIAQIHENSLGYVANPVFAANLFQQKVDEFIQELDVRQQLDIKQEENDDDGPADFSSCFQD
ncbi:MAG: hypothetical protein ABFS09_01240 [Thermodesulfobacteriota bacterium]